MADECGVAPMARDRGLDGWSVYLDHRCRDPRPDEPRRIRGAERGCTSGDRAELCSNHAGRKYVRAFDALHPATCAALYRADIRTLGWSVSRR